MLAQWISDPGHKWLKVRLSFTWTLPISGFSYMDSQFAYLEEDCDAHLFIDKYGKDNITFAQELYTDYESPVRSKRSYQN